ncbi:hypothetical protein NWE48_11990 [Escherichia coli]|nr:hypothetical protein [Escherichia coli]
MFIPETLEKRGFRNIVINLLVELEAFNLLPHNRLAELDNE